jgi:hypothetical protein
LDSGLSGAGGASASEGSDWDAGDSLSELSGTASLLPHPAIANIMVKASSRASAFFKVMLVFTFFHPFHIYVPVSKPGFL